MLILFNSRNPLSMCEGFKWNKFIVIDKKEYVFRAYDLGIPSLQAEVPVYIHSQVQNNLCFTLVCPHWKRLQLLAN